MLLWFTKKKSRNKSLWPSHWGKLSCHQGGKVVHLGKFNLLMEWLQPPVSVPTLPSNLNYNPLSAAHSIQRSYIFFMCKPTSGDLMFIFTNTQISPPVSSIRTLKSFSCFRTGENWPTEVCRVSPWWPPLQVSSHSKYLSHTMPFKRYICLISQYKERNISNTFLPPFQFVTSHRTELTRWTFTATSRPGRRSLSSRCTRTWTGWTPAGPSSSIWSARSV